MLALMLPGLAFMTSLVASADDIVLQLPQVVDAGSPFTINVNISKASWPNPECQGPGDCDWSYFRTYLMADPNREAASQGHWIDGQLTYWRQYCYLSGCVSTNVTSFNATIAADQFPNGGPYSFDYVLFNVEQNGSESLFAPTFSVFAATTFNITNSTGAWTAFALQNADYGIESYLRQIPCNKVVCIEACQTKWVAPYKPYVRAKGEELDACVAECQKGTDPREDCIVKNVTVASEEVATTTASTVSLGPTESATSKSTTTESALGPTATPDWGTRLEASLFGWALLVTVCAVLSMI